MAMGRKLNNSARKNDKNHISSYVSSRPNWPPLTEIWGPWNEYPGRRSCARNQVTLYNFEQSDWFGINYHIGILVYRDKIKIDPLYPTVLTCIPGYEQARLERSSHGGGVAIYIKDM